MVHPTSFLAISLEFDHSGFHKMLYFLSFHHLAQKVLHIYLLVIFFASAFLSFVHFFDFQYIGSIQVILLRYHISVAISGCLEIAQVLHSSIRKRSMYFFKSRVYTLYDKDFMLLCVHISHTLCALVDYLLFPMPL